MFLWLLYFLLLQLDCCKLKKMNLLRIFIFNVKQFQSSIPKNFVETLLLFCSFSTLQKKLEKQKITRDIYFKECFIKKGNL